MLSVGVLQAGATLQRRDAEQELLQKGLRLSHALDSYAVGQGAGQTDAAPQSMEDLLRDKRFPTKTVRHLRKIEVDPITGRAEWGIVRGKNGKDIVGFYSLSDATPVQTTGFPEMWEDFEGKSRYREWVFVKGMDNN